MFEITELGGYPSSLTSSKSLSRSSPKYDCESLKNKIQDAATLLLPFHALEVLYR